METSLKRKIVNAAESIKRKVRRMKNIESENEKVLESVFKPITNPLKQLIEPYKNTNIESRRKNCDWNKEDESDSNESDNDKTIIKGKPAVKKGKESDSETGDDEIPISNEDSDESRESPNISGSSFKTVESTPSTPNRDISSWSLSSEAHDDIPFGIRHERGKLMMGSARVYIGNDKISVAGQEYRFTPGVKELLLKKVPDMSLITQSDIGTYKSMLIDTNAHRRDYDPTKPIKSNKGRKYLNVIKPLFKLHKNSDSTDSSLPHGSGLNMLKKWKKNVDYVYWDDPNELVDRLKLLIASRDAGNTGLDNEIISIIEELREAGIIR